MDMLTTKFYSVCRDFTRNRRAVTAIEYALIAALIAVAIIGAVSTLGNSISAEFTSVAAQL
jgi:pilus assembly protein Flp/PilA